MELTINTPPSEWYVETPYNNLTYWRIDYPPLTAYVSMVCGYFSRIFDKKSVELMISHGYEDPAHKVFMRATVLLSDLLFFFPSVFLLISRESKKYSFTVRMCLIFIALLCPPFILIDSGHF